MSEPATHSMFLKPTTTEEVYKIINHLNNGAPGKDSITTKSLKLVHVSEYISEPLSIIINVSFSQGVFPSELKIAKLIPIRPMTRLSLVTIDPYIFYRSIPNYLKDLCTYDY